MQTIVHVSALQMRSAMARSKTTDNLKKKPEQGEAKPTETQHHSFVAQLRRERGTADSTPLPPPYERTSQSSLTATDEHFQECLKTSYQGFVYQTPDELEDSLHTAFEKCFQDLEELYLYDAVQAGGQRVSRTFVRRCLIGEPGSTYKYLGLRLFSHPWSLSSSSSIVKEGSKSANLVALGYTKQHARALIQMGKLNRILVQKTKEQLQNLSEKGKVLGSCEFTLTLVNRMEPSSQKKDLKRDPILQNKTSVSWHKDSGLMDFSSIAVYHKLIGDDVARTKPWRVALRVASPSSKTPALEVPLPSGALYYLLDDFNHQHEHAVLSGATQLRYSSTHRVARGQTWESIKIRCQSILESNQPVASARQRAKQVRAKQQLWTELEFEWIRQWCIQGARHAELHPYWHGPLKYLEECWKSLNTMTLTVLNDLKNGSPEEDLYDVMIESYQERIALREKWEVRLRDPLYATMDAEAKPMTCESCPTTLAELNSTLANLRTWKKRKFAGGKTKKEKRKVASNWEAMKKSEKKHKHS